MSARRSARSGGVYSDGQGQLKRPLPRNPINRSTLHHDLGLRLIKVLNVLLIAAPFVYVWLTYYIRTVLMFPSVIRWSGIILMFLVLYAFFGRTYDAFLISLKRVYETFYCQALAVFLADGFMFLVLWLMSNAFPNILPALATLACQLALSLAWCFATNRWYFAHYGGQKTGVVYDVRRGVEDLFGRYGMDKKFDVRFACTVEECLEENMDRLDDLDSVFLCGVHSRERNIILKHCVANGIAVYIIPRVGDVIMSGAKKIHMFHLPILRVDRYNPPPEYVVSKRAFDIVVSLAMLAASSPVMLLTALAIKLCDGGPVFYRQTRLTRDGKRFSIVKFRSMVVSAEQDGVPRLSTGERDPRITPVGRVIRAARIDELPQLFNVLSGSMSLVGPRPERPEIAAQYEAEMPEFALRLQAKAGLTGYAQVYGKYNTTPYDKLQMDLMYISRPNFVEDLKIIFATIMILFSRESTEGVSTDRPGAQRGSKPAA